MTEELNPEILYVGSNNKSTDRNLSLLGMIAEEVVPVSNRAARLAAMVLYRNRPIAIGTNSWKSHPLAKYYGTSTESNCIHAEVNAIKKAVQKVGKEKIVGCSLMVVRIKNEYNPNRKGGGSHSLVYGLAKPCAGCERCIRDHGIKKVIYSNDYDHILKKESYSEIIF